MQEMNARQRMPRLPYDVEAIHKIGFGKLAVTARDISEEFKVSKSTGQKAVRAVYAYALENGRKIYAPPGTKLAPVDLLFELYGWKFEDVARKKRELDKRRAAV